MQIRSLRKHIVLIILAAIFVACTLGELSSYYLMGAFIPFTGQYIYDPRMTHPNPLLVTVPPENVLGDYWQTRIGTVDKSGRQIHSFSIEQVVIDTYTDWQPIAHLIVRLYYTNGDTAVGAYAFNSGASMGIEFGNFAVSYRITYSKVYDCPDLTSLEQWCRLYP